MFRFYYYPFTRVIWPSFDFNSSHYFLLNLCGWSVFELIEPNVPPDLIEFLVNYSYHLIQIDKCTPSIAPRLLFSPDPHCLLKLFSLFKWYLVIILTFSLRISHLWHKNTFFLYFSSCISSFLVLHSSTRS